VAFSPNGQHLASDSGNGIVRLWDASAGLPLQTLEGHTHNVSFSPDGLNLVTDFGTLRIGQTVQSGYTQWIGCGLEIERIWITSDCLGTTLFKHPFRTTPFSPQ